MPEHPDHIHPTPEQHAAFGERLERLARQWRAQAADALADSRSEGTAPEQRAAYYAKSVHLGDCAAAVEGLLKGAKPDA